MTSLVHLPSCISAGLLFLDFLPPQQVDSASTCVCTCVFFRPFLFFFLVWLPFFDLSFSPCCSVLQVMSFQRWEFPSYQLRAPPPFSLAPFCVRLFSFLFPFLFSNRVPASDPHRKQTQNTSRFVYRPGKRLAAQRRCTADELFIITHSTLLFFFFYSFSYPPSLAYSPVWWIMNRNWWRGGKMGKKRTLSVAQIVLHI
jgi:hypothetical protein